MALSRLDSGLLTDLVDDDTAEGDTPLPPEGRLEQQAAARAQGAADDVGLQDDDALGFLWAPLNLRRQAKVRCYSVVHKFLTTVGLLLL